MDRARSTRAQRIGDAGEEVAARRLEQDGWQVLGRNIRFGRDEVDLVAVDPGPPAALVIVEVRWRSRRDFGLAEETLDFRKRSALRRSIGALAGADALPDGTPLPRLPLRVDLIAIDRDPGGHVVVRHHRAVAL